MHDEHESRQAVEDGETTEKALEEDDHERGRRELAVGLARPGDGPGEASVSKGDQRDGRQRQVVVDVLHATRPEGGTEDQGRETGQSQSQRALKGAPQGQDHQRYGAEAHDGGDEPCVCSTATFPTIFGIALPKQVGQSGQASPESVFVTTPPATMRTTVRKAAAAARRRITARNGS